MNSDDSINYDNNIYITILTFSSFFFILYLIYFISILLYIKRNIHLRNLTLFWINYSIISILIILFLGFYNLKLLIGKKERENNPDLLSSNFLSITINVCLVLIIYSIINNLIFDLVTTFVAYQKIKKISSIKIKEANYLELELQDIKLQDVFNEKNYFIIFIIFNIIHVGFSFLYFLGYIDTNIDRTINFFNINSFFAYLLRIYYFIVLFCLIVNMFLLIKGKKLLSNNSYYNENLFANKQFNIYSNRAMYFVNILNYEFIIQLLLNIPIILFLLLKMINIISFVILLISISLYLYIGAILYLNIDQNENNMEMLIPSMVKKLFCFKDKTIYFRNKNIKEIFNDFFYRYDINEKNKINKLELTLFKNINLENLTNSQMYPLQTKADIFNSSRKLFKIDPSLINRNIISNKRYNSDFPKVIAKTVIDFTSLCDYYVLYKLLYCYYQENKDVYDNITRKMNDDSNMYKKIFRRKSSLGYNSNIINNNYNYNYNINKQEFITSIERISRISIVDSKKIKTSLKKTNKDLFISLEEKDLLEEFKLKYGFKNSDIDFKIESMFTDIFSEIIPFFQLKIDDLLKGLIPSYNQKLFNIFIKKISPYKNKIEQNMFTTHNSLLIIEVYEKKEFINSEQLKKFIYKYKKYLSDTVKNMGFTFMPLVLGIFNIQIEGLSKIVIVYRNPLYFTLYSHFNNWITFYINESTEKLKASLILDDVIDLNEIEVKNSLTISEADFDEVKKNFQSDLNFLKDINIAIYPVIRLFVGDENGAIKARDSNNLGFNKNYKANNVNEPSILDDTANKQQNLSELLEMSDMVNLSMSKKLSNDFLENELNSVLEKEYYSMSGNDIHTIKIYFTNLFRTGNELSRKKRDFLNDNKEDVSFSYRKFIEDELFNYITKSSSFLDDNEKKEKEDNDIEIIIKKKMNLNEQNMIEQEEKEQSDSSESDEYERKDSNKKDSKLKGKDKDDIKNEKKEENNNIIKDVDESSELIKDDEKNNFI